MSDTHPKGHQLATAAFKKRTNVTVDSDLLDAARKMNLNISALAEGAIRTATREAPAKAWREENAETIEAYNAWVEKNGITLSRYRKF